MNAPERFRTRAELARLGLDRPDRDPAASVQRIRRGVYGSRSSVDAGPDEAYLRRVRASAITLTGTRIFSHESAAVLLGLPVLGRWPESVHLIDARRSGGRSQLDVVRHCLGLEAVEPVDVAGLLVTSPARTAFDFALSRPFASAVVLLDAVLRTWPGSRAELEALVAAHAGRRGVARVQRVLQFADPASQSVGESYSRVLMHEAGFVAPVLQFVVTTDGRDEMTDFAWPHLRTAGEFDGEMKYRLDRYRRGGSAEDVVIAEKNRENRIRTVLPNLVRWDWRDLRTPGRLEVLLAQGGIPRRS